MGSRTAARISSKNESGVQTFVAIDFETANRSPDSACALGMVRVEDNRIVERSYHLIRPPQKRFEFTAIHGIVWRDVAKAQTFGELWTNFETFLAGADFLAAHNATFDQGVLFACCDAYGIERPTVPFLCTVKLARKTWRVFPTKLPDVCAHLGINLDHHQALSDAEACAQIVIAASAKSA
ncbi:MAG: 3'-5' exonuclease [Thermosynechococcaceae cyanobacterium]